MLVSGVAVIVSMTGMFLARDAVFSSLAAGSIIVVAVAVLGSLTVLPAVLAKLGGRIDRPRVPVLWRWTSQTREPRLWPALLRPALRRPGRTLVIAAVAGALALPALGLHLASDTARTLPTSITEVHTLTGSMPRSPSNDSHRGRRHRARRSGGRGTRATDRTRQRLRSDARFATPAATPRCARRPTARADRPVDAPFDAESAQAATTSPNCAPPRARGIAGVPGARWAVGGETAYGVDNDHHWVTRSPG